MERLNALVEPATEALSTALKSGDTGAIVRTAIAVLDRFGYGPRSKVEVENKTAPIPLDQLSTDLKRQIIRELEGHGPSR